MRPLGCVAPSATGRFDHERSLGRTNRLTLVRPEFVPPGAGAGYSPDADMYVRRPSYAQPKAGQATVNPAILEPVSPRTMTRADQTHRLAGAALDGYAPPSAAASSGGGRGGASAESKSAGRGAAAAATASPSGMSRGEGSNSAAQRGGFSPPVSAASASPAPASAASATASSSGMSRGGGGGGAGQRGASSAGNSRGGKGSRGK